MKKSFLEFLQENNVAIHDVEIVSGAARGADRLGEMLARELGIVCKRFPADWDGLGKRAGYVRNSQMVDYSDGLLAFWDDMSRGTRHTINLAEKKGIITKVIRY